MVVVGEGGVVVVVGVVVGGGSGEKISWPAAI